ncbi:MAG: hypothetical protein HYR60_14855 [Acidobacteria bacterium]|nr:hypothetical protein [Acidobacteriota bacterium]
MKFRRILWRTLGASILLFLAAGIGAPYLNADRYGNAIRAALESSLGRRVEIGKVRFSLFSGAGFSIADVVIHEDPAFGIEPFAWVDSLQARPQLMSLWTRRLEFASLRLEDPIVNLVKTTRWNFEPLAASRVIAGLPKIAVRGGRINFKFGDTKSVFYLSNTDLDVVAPESAGEAWRLKFSGEPARTDRAARWLGSFVGQGSFTRGEAGRPERLNLDLELERSPIGEIAALIYGRDVGVHGLISSRLRLTGPLHDIQIGGRASLEELHRWDQTPMKDVLSAALRGRLDLVDQRLEVESHPDGKQDLPLSVRYRVAGFLAEPRWAVVFTCHSFPAEHLIPVARHMGAPLAEHIQLSGALDGAAVYSGGGSLQGKLAVREATLTLAGAPPIRLSQADVVLDGDSLRVPSAVVRAGQDQQADLELQYRWTTGELDLSLSSGEMGVTALPLQAAGGPAPLLDSLSAGAWKGRLRYQSEKGWSGQVELREVETAIPGIAGPVLIGTAAAQIQGARLVVDKIEASAGGIDFSGDYRYEPGAARPHRFRLVVPEMDAMDLERLWLPALQRREGFLKRTLGLGRAKLPDWLAARRAEGALQIGSLVAGDLTLTKLRARLQWDADRVRMTVAQAGVENGLAVGQLTANLSGAAPAYRGTFRVEGMDYQGGKLDADAVLETRGLGQELPAHLRAEGSFSGREIELDGIGAVKTASGCYKLDWAQRPPRLRLTELQLATATELFLGAGARQSDGRMLLQLSTGARQLRVTGTLAQLRAEPRAE